jgi:CubicO group peptidase (beta-lactamase class C family)
MDLLLLSLTILAMAIGTALLYWASRRNLVRLGLFLSSHYWKHTPTGHADTEGGLYLTPHDLAKIGYLFLRGGVWDGTRILWKNSFGHLP